MTGHSSVISTERLTRRFDVLVAVAVKDLTFSMSGGNNLWPGSGQMELARALSSKC
jgi:hypothetical protein